MLKIKPMRHLLRWIRNIFTSSFKTFGCTIGSMVKMLSNWPSWPINLAPMTNKANGLLVWVFNVGVLMSNS
jgi:hypothetical protein